MIGFSSASAQRQTLPTSYKQRHHVVRVRSTSDLRAASQSWRDLDLKHVIDSNVFDVQSMNLVFDVANEMERVRPGTPESKQLEGFVMATLFYEPSTRTRLSFEAAMGKLGGVILSTESAGEFSSAAKGETLQDTIRTVQGYCDCLVLRHPTAGSAMQASAVAAVPILSAGDGPGQHPTQALLDVYTIKQELGRLDNFKIAMVGDLANGRTVHSLAYLLSKFENVEMIFVAPPVVKMKADIKDFLTSKNVKWSEVDDLHRVAQTADVLYMTRIQKERFLDRPQDYESAKGKYIIDSDLLKVVQPKAVIMHPLPRVDEISTDVDADPRAAYFRQARNGLYVRMALLRLCLLGH